MDSRAPAADSTRIQVLDMLRRQPATVEELARAAGVTANAVRPLLVVLERDGLIGRRGVRRNDAPGKPPVVYVITPEGEAAFSTAYVPALAALVAALGSELDGDALRQLFQRAGRELAGPAQSIARPEQAAVACAVLESLGALVSTSAGEAGATVVAGTACPLAAAVQQCRETCEMVRALLAHRTGADISIACEYGERPRCRFVLAD